MNKRDKRLISMFIDYSLLAIAIVAGVFIIGIHVVQKNYYLFLFIAAIICSFKDVFGQSGEQRELMHYYRLAAEELAEDIEKYLKK